MPRPTTVVIPCYNEERRLDTDAFLSFLREQDEIGLFFVDDGSTDRTAEVLRALVELAPKDAARFRTLERNGGKAEAVRQGLQELFSGEVEAAGFWDADLATPLEVIAEFNRMLVERPQVEIVMGSRIRLLGRDIVRDSRRHYFGRMAATSVSLLLGLPIYDTQCGAKLFRNTPRIRSLFQERFVTNWTFDVELLARWLIARGDQRPEDAIVEVPLHRWTDVEGSKLTRKDFARAPIELLKLYRHYGPKLHASR